MYIDYVRVDNDIANDLFKGYYDDPINYPNQQWLQWESQIASSNSAIAFYIELFEFNQIPCMGYVSHKLDSLTLLNYGKHTNIFADLLCFYQFHLCWDNKGRITSPEQIQRQFINKTGSMQVFVGDPYPITAAPPSTCDTEPQFSVIPETLPIHSGTNILANSTSPLNYDAWLQGQLDTLCIWYEPGWYYSPFRANPGVFQYLMKRGSMISKQCNLPFYAMLQAHQWVSGGEVDREPTNEEFDLMTNLAVSYGAKGIFYWWYISSADGSNPDCNYSLGAVNVNGNPRYTNVYGEPKWDTLKRITQRLKKWGPTLMSFDNRWINSYTYRIDSERVNFLNSTYFADVVSYKSTPPGGCPLDDPGGTNLPNLYWECWDQRFIQVATFKNSDYSDHNQYFMIINKRCSPLQPSTHNDGQRFIRVKFDANSNSFPKYNSWKIINIYDGSTVASFDKTQSVLLDLGFYDPGEGRLYKISPVMSSGGNLVADENIENDNLICEDTVYTAGYNLIIGNNTSINFTDSSTFIINGGTFTIGDAAVAGTIGYNIRTCKRKQFPRTNFSKCKCEYL